MSDAEISLYRVYLVAPIDKRLGMRLDDAVELGTYEPEDPAWLPAVGKTFTLQGTPTPSRYRLRPTTTRQPTLATST